jgi:molybdopterin converting factor small subunit
LKYPDGVTSKEAGLETCKNIADKIVDPVIKATTSNIATILNAYSPEVLDMEMETIADIFVSVADKRYFCRYYKKEESKYKITGLSLIGKSTPAYCKVALKPILELVADKDSKAIIDYMETVKEGFISAPLKDVCTIKGVSAIDYFQEGEKFYKFSQETGRKNPAPFHSRGSIIHNMLLDKEGDTQNTRIRAGDKVYILPLKIPNPAFNQNVICFINPKVIEEHGLMKYVDYDIMFEKNFKKNIQLITEPIGWNLDPYQGVLDEWE